MQRTSTPRSIGTKFKKRPKLSAPELEELRLRATAVRAAAHNCMLVEEAYSNWCSRKAAERGLTGEVTIDIATGEIRPRG